MGDQHGLMRGYINFGLVFNKSGHPAKGLSHLKQALDLAKQTGNETTLGTIYMDMGDKSEVGHHWLLNGNYIT